MDKRAEEVLSFWRDDVGPRGWYAGGEDVDAEIRARFEPLWIMARDAHLTRWRETPEGALALVILLDQFPRNMFRDQPESFATDPLALEEAQWAVARGFDLRIDPPERQFFYMPFMHAENLVAQRHCEQLFAERMPGDNARHARTHHRVIARFGRFPWRNAALERQTTAEEADFLARGGYQSALAEQAAIDGG